MNAATNTQRSICLNLEKLSIYISIDLDVLSVQVLLDHSYTNAYMVHSILFIFDAFANLQYSYIFVAFPKFALSK